MKYFVYYTFVNNNGSYGDGNVESEMKNPMDMDTIKKIERKLTAKDNHKKTIVCNFIKLED